MTDTQGFPVRAALRDRLQFVEFRLLWEGRINRTDLALRFATSPAQASVDLRRYKELAGDGVAYDVTAKAYVTTRTFRPQLLNDSAEQYLAQLVLPHVGMLTTEVSWISAAPEFAGVPQLRSPIRPPILRALATAIRTQSRLQIQYHSLSNEPVRPRWISPYALVSDLFRWHVRAWCYSRREFRDFVISRVTSVGDMMPSGVSAQSDDEWSDCPALHLAPHPGLSESQRSVTALDYNMSNGKAIVTVRACLFRYVEWQLRLDIPANDKPSWQTQVVLVNADEVRARCAATRERATSRGRTEIPTI